jgi:hypothetical protein
MSAAPTITPTRTQEHGGAIRRVLEALSSGPQPTGAIADQSGLVKKRAKTVLRRLEAAGRVVRTEGADGVPVWALAPERDESQDARRLFDALPAERWLLAREAIEHSGIPESAALSMIGALTDRGLAQARRGTNGVLLVRRSPAAVRLAARRAR